MKSTIWKKLFLITSAFLIIFITITIYFQSAFFEKFYESKKTSNLQKNVEHFNGLYSNNYISNMSLYRMMRQFEEDNNAKIIILNSKGAIKDIGDTKLDTDVSKINTINKILKEWFSSPDTLNQIINSKKTSTSIYYNTDFDTQNIVCVSPPMSDQSTDVILAVASLQPIEEAADTIKEFYIYIFIGAVIMILLLSLIYSNMISKPLIRLNKDAVKIANMDFSVRCQVSSEDEIGNLANTLNFLSQRLNIALSDLQERNKQLEKDIQRERKLDRMRKDFVAGVSHELKTPIAIISGYAEGIKDNVADDESRDFYIDVIMDEASKMSTLVSDMLDLSQLESGTFKLNPGEFNIDELLTKCLNKQKQFIKEKEIDLKYESIDNAEVLGDKVRIEQVITNFLTNAIRHVTHGGKLDIRVLNEGNRVKVEIENQGKHIPNEELENIWDRFYKIDKSRNRSDGGTGLGLTIVKNILLMHNSTFGVRNTELGVCFSFTLGMA